MPTATLFDDGVHRNHLLEEFGHGEMVQANQHLIVHGGVGLILDPGGHRVFNRALAETRGFLGDGGLRYIFLSHQDPDVVGAVNGWLMNSDADAYVSALWSRFVPHIGLDRLVAGRLRPIPDDGMRIELNGSPLLFLPAHFLHSPGNFHLWDPTSRILYTGDLGGSLGTDAREVSDFDSHVRHMLGFHKRYMTSGRALKTWLPMVRELPVEIVAPQHGAIFRGRRVVERLFDWLEGLECGVDLLPTSYRIPS